MNGPEFAVRIAELSQTREPFAMATVVARRAPVSSHVGDRAIVFADGRMQGFVGGACSREIVRRQAVAAMRSGTPRLVQIRPGAPADADDASPPGTVVVPMTCTSEGAVDVYVEPHLPPRILLVAGFTPVADALARIGALLDGYRVVRVVEERELGELKAAADAMALAALPAFLADLHACDREGLAAVVATQGHYDEPALEALLARDALPYVALLASRKRAAGVFEFLERRGVARNRLESVRNPAGLDLGARRPGDVAISILAEIIEAASASEPQPARPDGLLTEPAADPVCGMDVDGAVASHVAEFEDRTYYFCCAQCRAAFLDDPSPYAAAAHA
jgi:xanthine dehydrogenase accessory factor